MLDLCQQMLYERSKRWLERLAASVMARELAVHVLAIEMAVASCHFASVAPAFFFCSRECLCSVFSLALASMLISTAMSESESIWALADLLLPLTAHAPHSADAFGSHMQAATILQCP